MFAKKQIFVTFSVIFLFVFMLAPVGSAHAALARLAEPTKTAEAQPSLLQPGINATPAGAVASLAVCPASIGFGETIQCSISAASEVDPYTFSANAGDKVLVRMSKSSSTIWPALTINGPGGTPLCDNYSSESVEIASCVLTASGIHSILAQDYFGTGTGDYYIYLQRLNNPGSPTPINFGQTLPGSILTPAEMDTYTFTASAGDKVMVRMSKSSGTLWPEVRIYSPDGIKLCDNYSSESAEIASCALSASGVYTILAHDYYGTKTGDYYLYLQRLNNPGSATPINFGQTLPGSILTPAEMDTYTFTASAGDKVLVRMSKSSGTLWPEIRIYSPDGIKLCDNYSSESAEIASCALSASGAYTILAHDYYGTKTGDYYLYLQRLNNPGSATPINFGQTLPGSILTPAEMDTYAFTADAGDKVLVRMSKSSGTIWPEIRIYSPDGIKLCDSYSSESAEIASCALTVSGAYTILAHDYYGTKTGDYYLYVQRLNNPGSPVASDFGQTFSGSILTPAEMDAYTFTADAGDKVLVRMSKSSGTLWPEIRIYSPGGTQLCDNYSSESAEIASCALSASGAYTILAHDYYGTKTGDYYLYLQRLNNPGNTTSINFGQTLPGSILTPAEMDTYTFTADAGDKVLVRMSKSSGTIWPKIRVYSPGGTQLCDNYSSESAEIASCALSASGAYTILAHDYYGTKTGDYYLYLQRLNNPGNTIPINFGQILLDSITTPAEMDTYTFTARAGDNYIKMSNASGTIWPAIRIYDSSGNQICDAYGSTSAEITSCPLTSNGTYAILAFDYFGTNTGGYYLQYGNPEQLKLTSIPSHDGWVLESSETSQKGGALDAKATTIRLGDDAAKKQYLGLLSFSTGAGLPDDAVITKVTLKVKKQGVTGGGNPVTMFKGFMVDIKSGTFGTAALQIGDFQAKASKTYGPFKPALAGGWYSFDLTAGIPYINKLATSSGLTQIRLRFKVDDNNNTIANYLSLFSGNVPAASRPQLIIEYYVP